MGFLICAVPAALALPAQASAPAAAVPVIVRLQAPPLALIAPGRRQLMGAGSIRRLDAASFGSRLYVAQLARMQDRFTARLRAAVPGATVERSYRVVLDALALRVPARSLARVERLAGVAAVYPVAYLPPADGHRARARGRGAAVGSRPLGRRPGHQGRRHRRRHRRGRAVPGAGGPASAGGVPARAVALHQRARDRRAQLRRPRRAECRSPRVRPQGLRARYARLGHHRGRLRDGRQAGPGPAGRARALRRGAGRLARQLPRARAR